MVLLLGYTCLHTQLTYTYADTTLDKLADFTARLPFAQRLLLPAIVHVLRPYSPINQEEIFFLLEWFFITLTYFSLKALLSYEFSKKPAQGFAWLFLLLLPLMSVINYRWTIQKGATFFSPSDTPMLFFMSLGFLLCLLQRWRYYFLLIFLATFNRESSILLVFLIPALHWQQGHRFIKPFLMALSSYCLARGIVLYTVWDFPGSLMEFYYSQTSYTYFSINAYWLFDMQSILFFVFCLAGLPLFWFSFYDYIPQRYRPIRYVALAYFLGLLLVGNIREGRLFGEILILLYLPVCIAVSQWINENEPVKHKEMSLLHYLNRYAVLSILMLVAIFRAPLNQLLISFLKYFSIK